MNRKDFPNLTRNSFRQRRNEARRDSCAENQRRRKRGKVAMVLRIANNRAIWAPER